MLNVPSDVNSSVFNTTAVKFMCELRVHVVSLPGLVCMKSSTSVVELVMLLCSQVSVCLLSSPAPHPPSVLPSCLVRVHIATSGGVVFIYCLFNQAHQKF